MNKLLFIKKSYLLTGIMLVLLLAGYELAFKGTWLAWQTHRQFTAQLAQAGDVSFQPDYTSRKNRNLDQLLKNYRLDSTAFRNDLVNTVTSLAEQEGVKLTMVPSEDAFYHTPAFIIQKLGFEGDFFRLLRFVGKVQAAPGGGMLRSVSWKVKKQAFADRKEKVLELEIYMISSK